MKTYGQDRTATTNRTLKGTSRSCPCCVMHSTHRKRKTKVYKKRVRQQGMLETFAIAYGR